MSLIDFVRQNIGLSDAAIASAYNVLPQHYRNVEAHEFAGWAGGYGRLKKMRAFIAMPVPEALPEDQKILFSLVQNGIEATLLVLNNPRAFLSLIPGSDQRQLLEAAVAFGVITQDDANGLIGIGTVSGFTPVGPADVSAARSVITQENLVNTRRQQVSEVTGWLMRVQAKVANDMLNPAIIDLSKPIPTRQDIADAFLDAVDGVE